MTAKSRVRKIQKRMRRNTDVNPYPGSNREADSAEEAQRGSRPVAIQLDGQARIQGISLVREGEGTGYILEVGNEATLQSLYLGDLGIKHEFPEFYPIAGNPYEEAVRTTPAPDAAPLADRGTSEAEGQPAAGIDWDIDRNQPARIPTHQVFFEQEVNGQPTHIESDDCYCGLDSHHWKDLGEI